MVLSFLRSICALLILSTFLYADDKTAVPLRIGMELNYPPFEMTDTLGNPAGIGYDMAVALSTYLHRPLAVENIPFEGLIAALKTKRIDLIISSMTDTAERRKSIDFSDPYLNTGLAILVSKDSPIRSITDLDQSGRQVVVKLGTTSEIYCHAHFKQARVLSLDQDTAAALEVVQGKSDAFIYDQMSIYQFAKKYPDKTRGLLDPFQKESWAIGIRKGNTELKTEVNTFLADFKSKKQFEILGDKYLKEDKEAFRKMGYPFYF